ncbi:hypothetical protein JJE66_26645 [Bradyrhizobium diazoefficiens]|uniref:hypothetical protein n=1 Tax=Bradyrhizobium diazoefficiens TaxID=1355477 RepID=UPI00190D75E1|nr:hypothetical protein [Bradyrhizobium diazoefficiens]MBK3664793.1 hypothetical protein [Bradyrhizobium diazoefficiens]
MPHRVQAIKALRAKLKTSAVVNVSPPLLSEGETYLIELVASQELMNAKLLRIVDDAPLGRGFSFQLSHRRIFIYEQDLRAGPGGMLLAMSA